MEIFKWSFCLSVFPLFCRVTSSEKVDKAKRYSEFCLCSVPFPGEVWCVNIMSCLPKHRIIDIDVICLLAKVVSFSRSSKIMATVQKASSLIGSRFVLEQEFVMPHVSCNVQSFEMHVIIESVHVGSIFYFFSSTGLCWCSVQSSWLDCVLLGDRLAEVSGKISAK